MRTKTWDGCLSDPKNLTSLTFESVYVHYMLYTFLVSRSWSEMYFIECQINVSQVVSDDAARLGFKAFTDDISLWVSWATRDRLHNTHLSNKTEHSSGKFRVAMTWTKNRFSQLMLRPLISFSIKTCAYVYCGFGRPDNLDLSPE